MSEERKLQEIIAKSVSMIVFHHNKSRTNVATAYDGIGFDSEARAIAREVQERWPDDRVNVELMDSIRDEMLARYGTDRGMSLYREFARAFFSAGKS